MTSSNWGVGTNWNNGLPTAAVDVTIPSGTPNAPSTAGVSASCRNLTVNAGATLTVDPASPLAVNGDIVPTGNISGGGTLRMVGNVAGALTGAGTITGHLECAKTGSGVTAALAANVTVTGNLTLTSGNLVLSVSPNQTLTVMGNAALQGGQLSAYSYVGNLDVAGNVTFSGTTCVSSAPTIRCGGNWTGAAGFVPTSGQVTFTKAGAQSISGTCTFPSLTINAGSVTTTSVPLTLAASLVVDGTFNAPQAVVINGSETVGVTGSVALGNATHSVLADLTVNGTVTGAGTTLASGSGTTNLSGTGTLSNLLIAKTGSGAVSLNGNLNLSGNLTQTSGNLVLSVSPNQTLTVMGNAALQGGQLNLYSSGILDVAGNVTFSGTTCVNDAPTIRCAGNWSADDNFQPSTSIVELDGTSPTGVNLQSGAASLHFVTLFLRHGTRVLGNGVALAAAAITVDSDAALEVDAGPRASVTATTVTSNGLMYVTAGGNLALGPGTAVTVSATGTLAVLGSNASPAVISGANGGGYTLAIDGLLAASNFMFSGMGASGVALHHAATIAPNPSDVRKGIFDITASPAGTTAFACQRGSATTFDKITFQRLASQTTAHNVLATDTGAITFTNFAGSLSGPAFELDAGNHVAWSGTSPSDLSAFTATPAATSATVAWTSTAETNVVSYLLERAPLLAGPYAGVQTVTAVGPHAYSFVDQPLASATNYSWRLSANLVGGAVAVLGTVSATTNFAPPGNVYTVGPMGMFSNIQSALAAATATNSIVEVAPGTYPSFQLINSTPGGVRVIADGTGPVFIDTAPGPVVVINPNAGDTIELTGLTIGSAGSPNGGLAIVTSAGLVIVDECTITGGAGQPGFVAYQSTPVVLQRSTLAGTPGLYAETSHVIASHSTTNSALIVSNSTAKFCAVTSGSTSTDPSSTLTVVPGVMPNMVAPRFVQLGQPFQVSFDGFPLSGWAVSVAAGNGFLDDFDPGYQMPLLFDLATYVLTDIRFTDNLGHDGFTLAVPLIPGFIGVPFIGQAITFDGNSGLYRFSNVHTLTAVP